MIDLGNEREGTTRSIRIGPATLYVTINQVGGAAAEVFIRSDFSAPDSLDGCTAEGLLAVLGRVISIALRAGVPPARIADALRRHRFPPEGGPGQPSSPADAIAIALEAASGEQS